MLKKKLVLGIGYIMSRIGLLSKKDYEYAKINLKLLLPLVCLLVLPMVMGCLNFIIMKGGLIL